MAASSSKSKPGKVRGSTSSNPSANPARGALVAAAAIAAGSAAWSAFLWQQLLVARSGLEAFCPLGGGCSELWDGGFATAIQVATGIPVAGWGLVWSLAALALPLLTRRRIANDAMPEPFWSATCIVAAGGIGGVAILALASLTSGALCTSCVGTYLIVIAYAAVIGRSAAQAHPAEFGRGGATTVIAIGVSFLALLYPGLSTPLVVDSLGAQNLAATRTNAALERNYEDELRNMIDSLEPEHKQILANALASYAEAAPLQGFGERPLHGSTTAPTHLTTFTDSSCGHCARFHLALEQLLQFVPPDSVSIEQRVFPLDDSCNPSVPVQGHSERCLAARARICLAADPQAFALTGWLHQEVPLSDEIVWRATSRLTPRSELETCMASETTEATLRQDVEMAIAAGIAGTPFVLVNGRPSETFIPFLFAMAVARANVGDPIFADLPEPVEVDPHAGHDHARAGDPAHAEAH